MHARRRLGWLVELRLPQRMVWRPLRASGLPAATTTDELLGVLYSVQEYDGVQLM